MAWLTQPVATITYNHDAVATQALLLSKLQGLGISAQAERPSSRTSSIVARCLTLCLNVGLWRCWSDTLEFSLEEITQNRTNVTIAAVPNLLRTRVRASDHPTDLGVLVAALQAE